MCQNLTAFFHKILKYPTFNRLKEEHIVVSTDGPWDNVLKFKPPMCFSMDDAYKVTLCIDHILTDIKTLNLKLEKDDI